MKIVSLMAGAAVAALFATSAMAQVAITETNYVNTAGTEGDDAGTVSDDITATFGVSGNVVASCILGNGDAVLDDVNFGNIGIYGDAAAGVDNAFEMVQDRNGNSSTNAAGCNTSNRLTLTKTGGSTGMSNADASAAGYDPNVFQANLPYSLAAVYASPNVGSTVMSGTTGKFSVADTATTNFRENGAWRGDLGIKVVIPVPVKALVAGAYTDTVTVQIEAI